MRHLWTLIFCLCLTSQVACQPLKTVNVNVVGDDGNPIEGAEVVVWFYGYQPEDSKSDEGFTNEEGNFHAQGRPLLGMLARVNKDGYYQTEKDRLPMTEEQDQRLTLRKKIKPIPLYAKRWRIVTENTNKNLGFDFEKGDWVAPYGKGVKSDVIFNVEFSKKDIWTYEYKLKVSFPNEFDGIQTFETAKYSELKSPHLAPLGQYKKVWVHKSSRNGKNRQKQTDSMPNRNYWLRVRSKVDDDGKLIAANYVKVYGNFPDFHYYFNPTPNDLNLEFDPSQNLIKGLKYGERVNLP
ncbi:carboxypeptidase-like regulatory domain-containing protein [Kiritimatiellota bacterium B12222]|nr:carboxypeptidase-like regulatory domain-containing protein [Kiritimatiellota bacterium B12222]